MTDENRDVAIHQLNSYLREENAAVETYDEMIGRTDDEHVIAVLRDNRISHAVRAYLLTNLILQLGGVPADRDGVWESFAKVVERGERKFGASTAIEALEVSEIKRLRDYTQVHPSVVPHVRRIVARNLLPEQEITHGAMSLLKNAV